MVYLIVYYFTLDRNHTAEQAMKIILTTRNGTELPVFFDPGTNLMEAIRASGVDELLALCGGSCPCATCHVFLDPNFAKELPPVSADEDDLLDSSDYRNNTSRLSCQIELTGEHNGLRVTIAPED